MPVGIRDVFHATVKATNEEMQRNDAIAIRNMLSAKF
jgi:hypothetical protein